MRHTHCQSNYQAVHDFVVDSGSVVLFKRKRGQNKGIYTMVQHDTSSSSDENQGARFPDPEGVPVGNYRLVGWAVDTTGRRLIDEIVQLAGYTPESQFSQYIMPFADLNPFFSRKYNVRIFNALRYRRLKDLRTGQFLKTKSEICALRDFVQWLETVKGDHDGVLLVYHEVRKTTVGMLLEALRRNQLLERFELVCKGFANGFSLARAKCQSSIKTYNLKVMGKVLLGQDSTDYSSAVDRASAIYGIAVHLAQGERAEPAVPTLGAEVTSTEPELIQLVCPHTNSISAEEREIESFKVLLQRQNTFRPVFGALMKASPTERQHASHLRRLLAENNIDYDKLKDAFDLGGKEGLDKILKEEIGNAKQDDLTELLEILDCFFDPDKQPVKPKTTWSRFPPIRRPRKSFSGARKNRTNKEEVEGSADATTSSGSEQARSVETSPRNDDVKVPAN